MGSQNLITIFLTGLITGGLTCLAVQGGLLTATIAKREEEKLKEQTKYGHALPIISFLVAKLIAYTLLGFLLGWFGSLFQLSITARVIMQFAVAIFMIGTALNILNVHPIFRYFVIQPPKFLTRLVRNQSKSTALFAPALLGAFTVFIPCGTTQAMMALAIGSGSTWMGAAILFAFVLGTSPLFFILGYFATKLGNLMQQRFMKVVAYVLILLAVFNANSALALSGSNVTLESIGKNIWCTVSFCNDVPMVAGIVSDNVTINFEASQYVPNTVTVKTGAKVKLTLVNNNGAGCIQAFTIPKLGIQKIVRIGSRDTIEFTAPNEPQQLSFMCSMGMYRGVINVI